MSGGDDSKFKEINEAYDILKDPQKKQQYDLGGFDPFQVQQVLVFPTTGFDDIIKDQLVHVQFNAQTANEKQRCKDS